MDYILIFLGMLIGAFVALMEFGAGKLGATGDVMFNYIKGGLCVVVGAVFGAWVAIQGGELSPEVIATLFGTFTFGGMGVVWLIDLITQMIVSFLQPKSSLAQGMAIPRPRV
jgi:uncharacterized membrane protein SpoIIM required for sporulation